MENRYLVSILAAGMMLVGSAARAQQNVCQDNIEQVLSEHGVKLSDVANPTWQTQRWYDNGPVSGYQFHGQPGSCSSGSLHIMITTGCHIADMYTVGDCMIDGIPRYW
jgi:hypothetical protein